MELSTLKSDVSGMWGTKILTEVLVAVAQGT